MECKSIAKNKRTKENQKMEDVRYTKKIKAFLDTVQTNCDIADASGSRIFSICGMALRLRDLNKWEKNLDPWQECPADTMVDWIDKKETLWESLEGSEFAPLVLDGESFDPFDTAGINQRLSSLNLFYGAGYAHSLKPSFFLAEIEEKQYADGIPVILTGREYKRDLLTLPALNQDRMVVIRRHAGRLFLWDQMIYLKESGKRFLNFALHALGLPSPSIKHRQSYFDRILSVREETYIRHEIGEIKDEVMGPKIFRHMMALFPHTAAELLVRTVKDLLADTGPWGTLSHLIRVRDAAGLGFYAAFQEGLFRPLFPELRAEVTAFMSNPDWERIEGTRQKGFDTATRYARHLISIYREQEEKNSLDQAEKMIHDALVAPLVEKHRLP